MFNLPNLEKGYHTKLFPFITFDPFPFADDDLSSNESQATGAHSQQHLSGRRQRARPELLISVGLEDC